MDFCRRDDRQQNTMKRLHSADLKFKSAAKRFSFNFLTQDEQNEFNCRWSEICIMVSVMGYLNYTNAVLFSVRIFLSPHLRYAGSYWALFELIEAE